MQATVLASISAALGLRTGIEIVAFGLPFTFRFDIINNFKEQDRMFVAIDSHMRDKSKINTLSPILFSRHSAAMLADGLFEKHKKSGLRSSSEQSYSYICFRPGDGSL